MAGMQKKFLVPLRAQYRAIHQARPESKFAHRSLDVLASRAVQFRIANNTALAHLPFANFELRFDQYNHLAVVA